MDKADLIRLHGNIKDVTLPSGLTLTIREQNGEDDEIISNSSLVESGDSINSFIAGIIIDCESWPTLPGNLREVMKMLLRDKYSLLLQSRIFSMGNELEFSHDWNDGNEPEIYGEDLNIFVADYSKPLPKPGEEGYKRFCFKPYHEVTPTRELLLSSGKKVRYSMLNGYTEKNLLNVPVNSLSINTEMVARELHLEVENQWIKVTSFKMFSPKDMSEIRSDVKYFDEKFDLTIEIINSRTNEKRLIPVLSIPNFFFPHQI